MDEEQKRRLKEIADELSATVIEDNLLSIQMIHVSSMLIHAAIHNDDVKNFDYTDEQRRWWSDIYTEMEKWVRVQHPSITRLDIPLDEEMKKFLFPRTSEVKAAELLYHASKWTAAAFVKLAERYKEKQQENHQTKNKPAAVIPLFPKQHLEHNNQQEEE